MRRVRTTAVLLLACLLAVSSGGCAKTRPDVGSPLGRIRVTVATEGLDRNHERLTFSVDIQPGGAREPIPADAGFLYYENLPAGTYVVRLIRLPQHCRARGPSQRQVTVSPGDTARASFAVTCGRPLSRLAP